MAHAAAIDAPPSPTLSAATAATRVSSLANHDHLRPPHLITRADLRASLAAYDALLAAAKAYTNSMLQMAQASSALASSLEACSRVKGAHLAGASMQAASGLHHLLSNHQSLLADVLWKHFTIPLLEHSDAYRIACAERQASHERLILEKSKELREAESRNLREGRRKKGRDLDSFKRALAELQARVDELEGIKSAYYHEVLEGEEEVWQFILAKVSHLVRSQMDVYERVASKGTSDPLLEAMLATVPDPFSQYGPPKPDGDIFGILPAGGLGLVSPTLAMGSGAGANAVHSASAAAGGIGEVGGVTMGDASVPHSLGAAAGGGGGATAAGTSTGAMGAAGLGFMSPAILSPRTPSTGLPRNAHGVVGGARANGKSSSSATATAMAPPTSSSSPSSDSPAPAATTTTAVEGGREEQRGEAASEGRARLFGADTDEEEAAESDARQKRVAAAADDPLRSSAAVPSSPSAPLSPTSAEGAGTSGASRRAAAAEPPPPRDAGLAAATLRLKHALSIIDEAEAGGPRGATPAGSVDVADDDDDDAGEPRLGGGEEGRGDEADEGG